MDNHKLIVDEQQRAFKFDIDGKTAMINYRLKDGKIYSLDHTEVPDELQGQGIASDLAQKTLTYIKESGSKILPLCSFVAAYVKRHPEWNDIVAHG